MSEYDNTNRGALFTNNRKESDRHPDWTGTINVEGTDFWISGWVKVSKAGAKYLSLSVTEKDSAGGSGRASGGTAQAGGGLLGDDEPQSPRSAPAPSPRPLARPPQPPVDNFDEDIPF